MICRSKTGAAKTIAAGLLIAVSLVALVGCSSDSGQPTGASPKRDSPGNGSLDATQWRLAEWTLSSLSPADFTITAEFANGRISGTSGVNSYSGPYKLGPGAAFSAGPLASTQMAGPEPAMRAESAYLALLGQATAYKKAAGRLTLFDEGGNESLIFGAAGK